MSSQVRAHDLARMSWHQRAALAKSLGCSLNRLPTEVKKRERARISANKYRRSQRKKAWLDRQPDADVLRCKVCGAWMIGECRVNHGWRP